MMIRRDGPEHKEAIERRQLAQPGDPDYFVHTRAEDRSFWIKTAYYAEKYKILVWIVGMFLIAIGFDFKLPSTRFSELDKKVDGAIRRIDESDARRDTINAKLDALITFKCLETTNPRDMQLARINCTSYLNK